jgi:hypothetical protein
MCAMSHADSGGIVAGMRGLSLAPDCETSLVRSAHVRSKITNQLRASLSGVDGRSERGRRWRDILEALIAEYGLGWPDRLRELASLKLSLEATQAAVINGDTLRSEDLVRLANLITRRERELKAKARAAAGSPPSLRGKLAGRYGGKPAASP